MKIEIPFNENLFKEQLQLHFEVMCREKINQNNITLLLLFLVTVTYGTLIFFISTSFAEILITIFFGLLFYLSVKQKLKYKKSEKIYFEKMETEIEEYKLYNQVSIFEFTEEFVRWENYKMNLQFKWDALTKIRLIDKTIFFDIATNLPFLIISENEIGEEHYKTLIKLLTNKQLI